MKRFESHVDLKKEDVKNALNYCIKKIDESIDVFTYKFPSSASENNMYYPIDNNCWTTSFWTGMLFLAYETTGDEKYKNIAEIQLGSFKDRVENRKFTDTHDLGFIYSLSAVAAYKLTGDEDAKKTALLAAELLTERFKEKGQFIQAWGSLDDPNNYRFIIDCLMNLPLLYWASDVTGDSKYYNIAHAHANTSLKYIVRDDFSTYHTFFFDRATGKPLHGATHQGYSDSSCWARGQAWGIYGFILSYIYTQDDIFLDIYKSLSDYFIKYLPCDDVPYWDLCFTSGGEPRDTSAAAIAVCGMFEAAKHLDKKDNAIYMNTAKSMLKSLIQNYTTQDIKSNGILKHAVYNYNGEMGVDECCIWGDYFFMEALVRVIKDWNIYW